MNVCMIACIYVYRYVYIYIYIYIYIQRTDEENTIYLVLRVSNVTNLQLNKLHNKTLRNQVSVMVSLMTL